MSTPHRTSRLALDVLSWVGEWGIVSLRKPPVRSGEPFGRQKEGSDLGEWGIVSLRKPPVRSGEPFGRQKEGSDQIPPAYL